jgi:DNA mismatch endonuclease (patch repair protein)
MADVVPPDVRSKMMAGIRGKNTKPEMIVRRGLHRAGLRFKLHDRTLPGTPDLVFPKHRAVLFVHGCFWHGHDCALFKWPKTREDFWKSKIVRNRELDGIAAMALVAAGWRHGVVWECALKGRKRIEPIMVFQDCIDWLKSGTEFFEVKGSAE